MKTVIKERKDDAIRTLVKLVPLPEHVEGVILRPVISRYINHNTNLRNGFIFCPFHHEVNEPSFSWHREKNYGYCFGCKQGGDVVMLHYLYLRDIVKQQGVSYNDALIDLANMYNINIPEFIMDEKSALETIKEMVQERSQTKRRKIADIRKATVISLSTIVRINNDILRNDTLTLRQKLIKLEILDEIVCLSDTISINQDQLLEILNTVGG